MNKRIESPKEYSIIWKKPDAKLILFLSGRFGLKNLISFTEEIRSICRQKPSDAIEIDFSGIAYIDSAAALALIQFRKEAEDKSINCVLTNLSKEAKGIFSVINEKIFTDPPLKTKTNSDGLFIQIGDTSVKFLHDAGNFISFLGEIIYAIIYTILHPGSLRGRDVLFYIKRAGVDGLPIVGLISLLMGLIIAFMSYLQLRLMGANIYVPTLVSFAMVKELGPIMTAIIVAGRSGSAFAAEIGTMVVNEEVDALKTMGFDPLRFIAVPKIFATVIVVPLLTIYADFFGILGGLIVGVTGLDLTVNTYLTQSIKPIKVFDVITSLIKAAVFAALIAGVGCYRGFQVRSGAQDVGKFTTSAVVSAIFLIVVTNSIFAIVLYYIS